MTIPKASVTEASRLLNMTLSGNACDFIRKNKQETGHLNFSLGHTNIFTYFSR